jgi:ATP-binding cassette subfamily C protein
VTANTVRTLTSVENRGAIPMLLAYVRAYPARAIAAMLAVFVAGLLDGLGLSMLLSMLSLAGGEVHEKPSAPEKIALHIADFFHLPHTPVALLSLAIGLIASKAILTLLANRQVGYTVAHIATDLRLALIRAVLRASWPHYLSQSVGRLSNSVATEAQRAAEAFQSGAETAAMMLNSLIYLGVALSISAKAGGAAAVAGVFMLLLARSVIKASRRAGQKQTELLKSLLSVITGRLSAAKALKAMALEDHVDALLSDQTRQLKKSLRKQVIAKETLAAIQDPLVAVMVGVGFYFSLFVLKMQLAEVLVMLFLLARVIGFLSKSQKAYQQVVVRESAYWSIVSAIGAAQSNQEDARGTVKVKLSQELRFDDVSFAHEGGRRILDRQSVSIPSHALTVIVGPSGAGKTTMIDLVVGLLQPVGGRILVDGTPLADIDLRDWRGQIGYVPQDTMMVDESVVYNLTLGEAVPEAEVRQALEDADALDFVLAMPDGWNTPVGQGGSRLSGGQRQRLAIARALIHHPRLLILDEATSNLDQESQTAVIDTVRHLKGKLTILAVAHQERLIQAADHILRLEDGRLERIDAMPEPARMHG